MAAYTAKDVSELRQRTQAGMMDCKKALEECQGDMEQAVEWLRKKGISRGESRAGRAASEGKIVARVAPDGATGVLVELNSETDFVARNEAFGQTVEKIADTLLASGTIDGTVATAEGSPLLSAKFGDAGTLADALKQMTGTIGGLSSSPDELDRRWSVVEKQIDSPEAKVPPDAKKLGLAPSGRAHSKVPVVPPVVLRKT